MIQSPATRRPGGAPAALAALLATLAFTAGALAEGGDTPATALLIEGLPFADSGDTSDNGDTEDPDCAEPDSPDVWYRIVPEEPLEITLSLCGSSYDTSLYVLDEFLVQIACNNDSDACGEQSELPCLAFEPGKTYYIAVDGDGGTAGPYQFAASVCLPELPCDQCASFSFPEGEPTCYNDYVDEYNGGCNSSPHVFQPILAGETVCGESGTYELTRELWSDTDWYELQITETSDITWEGIAQFPLYLIIWDGNEGCDGMYSLGWRATNSICEPLSVTAFDVPPGTYWLWVGLWTLSPDYPCGSLYNARVTVASSQPCDIECDPDAIEEGEEICFDGYVDDYNGGCNSDPFAFQPVVEGSTICGTSGTYLFGPDNYRDTDWYEFTTEQICDLSWQVLAEFDMVLFLIDAIPEACPDPPIRATIAGAACQITTLSYADLGPGTYWLFIAPAAWTGVPCGSEYEATFTLSDCENPPECPEDIDGDGLVNTADLLVLLGDWGCEGPDCDGDVNADQRTDTEDLLLLLGAWGECP
ncbi:MAG: hypothetical protein SYC29_13815 [Planctomycetota bacterium]|nr:hypothetical protein [Planctomycetota bacterium]